MHTSTAHYIYELNRYYNISFSTVFQESLVVKMLKGGRPKDPVGVHDFIAPPSAKLVRESMRNQVLNKLLVQSVTAPVLANAALLVAKGCALTYVATVKKLFHKYDLNLPNLDDILEICLDTICISDSASSSGLISQQKVNALGIHNIEVKIEEPCHYEDLVNSVMDIHEEPSVEQEYGQDYKHLNDDNSIASSRYM